MKLKEKRKNPKKLIIIYCTVVILLLFGAGTTYLLVKRNDDAKSTQGSGQGINYSEPTKEQKKAGEEADKASGQKEEAKNQQPTPVPPKNQSVQKKPTSVTIASMLQDESGILRVRAIIEAIEAEGTCSLTVTKAGVTIFTASAKSESRSSYATCQGFDITRAQLGGAGQVSITIHYSGAAYEGGATGEVTVQ